MVASLRHGYPRPLLQRGNWISLNGSWDFALDVDGRYRDPREVRYSHTIQVPFAPETPASGIGHTGFMRACWYRHKVDPPPHQPTDRVLLHFGAVDYRATVWVNGLLCAQHQGGYTPFTVDVTALCREPLTIIVRAEDDPADLAKPRGKQDWQLEPHSIWYPRTTGIWQTVWLERVPQVRIDRMRWTPNMRRWEVGLEAYILGDHLDGLRLHARLSAGGRLLCDDTYEVLGGEVHRRIALSDPGIDDFRNELLWSPSSPTLIQAELQLWAGRGRLLDEVRSYTALRSIAVENDRVVLNGRPYFLRMVLDQGYWPEGGLTAPSDDALRRDVELVRAMGFNGVRMHQKVADPRYLYWADTLGVLVWGEMPSAYRFTRDSVHRTTSEWMQVIDRDYNHPCIIAWVPINESWGVPNLPENPTERHYVQALYHLTRTLDPTRLVVGNDGWEAVATDIIGIHDYDPDPDRLARRYRSDEQRPHLLKRERPGGRLLVLPGHPLPEDHPLILSEFGGIALSADPSRTWGYSRSDSADALSRRYGALLEVVNDLGLFSGFCYTQFADTFQEVNGLLYADRTPKFPLHEIAAATIGRQRWPGG